MRNPPELETEEVTEYSLEELLEKSDLDATAGYLLADWFYRAMGAIRDTRLRNGLTQSDVAEKIGTTQSVVARMENAHRGSFSLDRFLEYAWACGAAPLQLEFGPPEELRQLAIERSGRSRSGDRPKTGDLPNSRTDGTNGQNASDRPRVTRLS